MPSPQAAYYMIEGKLEYYCQELNNFPQSVFWIHETVLVNYLGIPRGKGEHGQRDALTSLLACIKQGRGGSPKGEFEVKPTELGGSFDLGLQDNGLGVCFQQYGKRETFVGGELAKETSERQPRWFHFGNEFPIQVKDQILIVNNLIGKCNPGKIDDDDPAKIPMYQIQRRNKHFRHYFEGGSQGAGYKNYDIPAIASV